MMVAGNQLPEAAEGVSLARSAPVAFRVFQAVPHVTTQKSMAIRVFSDARRNSTHSRSPREFS